jgi:uncharacterized membrane protein YeaQ/YmgE (transglycosylase-associated protein family)
MNITALAFAFGTVLCWGVYSVLLHMGSVGMGQGGSGPPDLTGNRMKAFLLVGIAYFIVAIVGPIIVLKMRGTPWTFPTAGWSWSLVAGFMGAIGAFFLLMALSSGRTPLESKSVLPLLVPAIVFAGAPIVNVLVATTKEGNWSYAGWKFFVGILLAAVGTVMVMEFKPVPPDKPASAPANSAAETSAPKAASNYGDVSKKTYHIS